MAGFLDGILSHDSLIWVWFLSLTPGYSPISSSSLRFTSKKRYFISSTLSHLFRVPNPMKKSLLTPELMHHGAASSAGPPETTQKQKMSEKGKPRANFYIVPGSTMFPFTAGLVIQLLEKSALKWVSRASIRWQHLIYSKDDICSAKLALITKSGSLTSLSPH